MKLLKWYVGMTMSFALLALAVVVPQVAAAADRKLKVTWPAASTAGQSVSISGVAPKRIVAGSRVTLERKAGKRWKVVARGRVWKRAAFSLSFAPTASMSSVTLRVRVLRGRRVLAVSKPKVITVRVAASTPTGTPGSPSAPATPVSPSPSPLSQQPAVTPSLSLEPTPSVTPTEDGPSPTASSGTSEPFGESVEGGGRGGGGYPDDDAIDCSGRFGKYSWCKGGTWLSPRRFAYRNCTDFVAWYYGLTWSQFRFPAGSGDAANWKDYAGNAGLTVHSTPAVGDIAWWGREVAGGFGHVAVVTGIAPSGAVTVAQYNGDGHGNYDVRPNRRADAYLRAANAPLPPQGGGTPVAPAPGYPISMQSNGGDLWSLGAGGLGSVGNWRLGMMSGTSPSVARLANGGFVTAFQSNSGNLWSVGAAGAGTIGDWKLGMKAGTSPSVTRLATGGYVIAFQANDGDLWTVGTDGAQNVGDWNLGMKSGTSPSVTGLPNGGYVVAFQANDGDLWTIGSNGATSVGDWNLGMRAGTSPSVAARGNNGYTVAFQSNSGNLWSVGAAGAGSVGDWKLGMQDATSPSVAALAGGGYVIAFQANDGDLWSVGGDGAASTGDWNLGMRRGTSPSVAGRTGGAHVLAFQGNDGDLWSVGAAGEGGTGDWNLGMEPGSSPAIAP